MDRVVTVNLNGVAIALEDGAYTALRAYLDAAGARLSDNLDRAEIMADLEQAIADRARSLLGSHKSVVSAAEMERILGAMGPVEGGQGEGESEGEGAGSASGGGDGAAPRRKLYRLRDGAMAAGVANGVGAYFGLDATVVRIAFVIAVLLSGGWAALVYIVMMFVVPSANTSEEWAAAHGLPATAQEVIETAQRRFASLGEKARTGAHAGGWSARRKAEPQRFTPPASPPAGFFTRVIAGIFAFGLSVVGAAATLALGAVLAGLITQGAFFGFRPLDDMPIWVTVLLIVVVFAAFATPVQALRVAAYETLTGVRREQAQAMDGGISLGLIVLFGWLAFQVSPEARALMLESWSALQDLS